MLPVCIELPINCFLINFITPQFINAPNVWKFIIVDPRTFGTLNEGKIEVCLVLR